MRNLLSPHFDKRSEMIYCACFRSSDPDPDPPHTPKIGSELGLRGDGPALPCPSVFLATHWRIQQGEGERQRPPRKRPSDSWTRSCPVS